MSNIKSFMAPGPWITRDLKPCVTLADHEAAMREAVRLLTEAVRPHGFNCGYVKHDTEIKMVPVGHCTCGIAAFLAAHNTEGA